MWDLEEEVGREVFGDSPAVFPGLVVATKGLVDRVLAVVVLLVMARALLRLVFSLAMALLVLSMVRLMVK